jgi:hypothetical protein
MPPALGILPVVVEGDTGEQRGGGRLIVRQLVRTHEIGGSVGVVEEQDVPAQTPSAKLEAGAIAGKDVSTTGPSTPLVGCRGVGLVLPVVEH